MTNISRRAAITLLALLPVAANAQAVKSFRARLSAVPIDLTMAATIAGSGSVTATLNGNKLNINGTFDGLKSSATVARLHKGQRGVRGEPILDLTVTKATSGTISANLDLTPQQVQDLQQMRLYVQLHSEKAPDGNLWGWLLPQESKR
jgi:CHRD domain